MEEVSREKTKKAPSKRINLRMFGLAMFLLGAFVVVAIRFVAIKDVSVHYHANFALYINDQRDEFKNFTFYEEVQACSLNDPDNVKTRAHMHDENPGLIHVHAHGVTWGQFFENLGYTLGDKVVATDNGVYADNQDGSKLNFILNGEPVQSMANKVIKSEDKLLINYGKDNDQIIQDHYKTIPADAHQANTQQDPSTCSGSHKLTFWTRLKQSIGLDGNP